MQFLIKKLGKPEIISEILRDIGQVFFASILIEPALNHSASWESFSFGLISSSVSWLAGLILAKK